MTKNKLKSAVSLITIIVEGSEGWGTLDPEIRIELTNSASLFHDIRDACSDLIDSPYTTPKALSTTGSICTIYLMDKENNSIYYVDFRPSGMDLYDGSGKVLKYQIKEVQLPTLLAKVISDHPTKQEGHAQLNAGMVLFRFDEKKAAVYFQSVISNRNVDEERLKIAKKYITHINSNSGH